MADQLTGLLSPFLRSRRIAAVEPFLGKGRLLDIGCGTGTLANHVNSTRYLGVDQDEESIAIAKNLFPTNRWPGGDRTCRGRAKMAGLVANAFKTWRSGRPDDPSPISPSAPRIRRAH